MGFGPRTGSFVFQQEIMGLAHDIQKAAIDRAINNQEAYKYVKTIKVPLDPYKNVSAEQYYANIPSLFEPFSMLPDPGSYQSMIDSLREAMGYLRISTGGPDPTDRTDVLPTARPEWDTLFGPGSAMPDWNGSAATAFKNKFLGPLPAYTQNQLLLIALLRSSVEAQQALWKGAQQDIRDIAKKTKDALGHYGGCGSDTSSWVIAFVVLAAVATVAVPLLPIIVAGEVSVATATTVTAIGASTTAAGAIAPIVAPDSLDHRPSYSGDTAAKIIQEMQQAMTDLTQRITNVQNAIHEHFTTMIPDIKAHRSALFEPPRPSVADKPIDQK